MTASEPFTPEEVLRDLCRNLGQHAERNAVDEAHENDDGYSEPLLILSRYCEWL
jgi:hypothetical protein